MFFVYRRIPLLLQWGRILQAGFQCRCLGPATLSGCLPFAACRAVTNIRITELTGAHRVGCFVGVDTELAAAASGRTSSFRRRWASRRRWCWSWSRCWRCDDGRRRTRARRGRQIGHFFDKELAILRAALAWVGFHDRISTRCTLNEVPGRSVSTGTFKSVIVARCVSQSAAYNQGNDTKGKESDWCEGFHIPSIIRDLERFFYAVIDKAGCVLASACYSGWI